MNRRLKAAIIENFETQRQFGKLMGLSEQNVTRLVTGRVIPPEPVQRRIASILNRPAFELFPRGCK